MTTVIGIKCSDGLVLACDSQSSFGRGIDVKRLNQQKVFFVDDKTFLSGSGSDAQIKEVYEQLLYGRDQFLQNRIQYYKEKGTASPPLSVYDYKNIILYDSLLLLHKKYNVSRAKILDLDHKKEVFFNPTCIFCARIDESSSEVGFLLCLLFYDGFVEPKEDYATVGTGSPYAELLLKSLYRKDITVEEASMLAPYIMSEVLEIDKHSGGSIVVVVLGKKEGAKYLTEDQINKYITQVRPTFGYVNDVLIPMVLKGEIDDKTLEKYVRQGRGK